MWNFNTIFLQVFNLCWITETMPTIYKLPLHIVHVWSLVLRDYFSSFDKILVHLKLQTCFVLPGLFSAIRSFQKMFIKIEWIRIRDIQSRIQNTTISMYSLETLKMKKYFIKTMICQEINYICLDSTGINWRLWTILQS